MKAAAIKYKEEKKYTYADYLTWDDNQRLEIINGEIYEMSPAPNTDHQRLSRKIGTKIDVFLSKGKCEMFYAPFDVRFPEGVKDYDKIIDVVQPDIVVICDPAKIDQRGCQGAPDFIIEILSPSTAYKDMSIKHALYELNKVKEYWLIDPINKLVILYLLGEDGRYGRPAIYRKLEKLKVTTIEGLEIDLDEVFKSPHL